MPDGASPASCGRKISPRFIAIAVIGLLWLPTRIGRDVGRDALARAVWIGVAILLVTIAWGVATVARGIVVVSTLAVPPPVAPITSWAPLDMALAILLGFALTLPVLGGGEALARAAHELPPPRVQALRRTGLLTVLFAGVTTTLGTFLALLLVPASEQPLWANAPLAGLAQHLAAPSAIRVLMAVALAGAAVLILGPAAHAAFGDTEQMLHRASTDGTLPSGLASLHTRFGTPARAVDVTVVAMVLVVLATGGRVAWLSRAYGIAIAVMLVLTIASLARLRRARQGAIPFKARGNVRSSGREIPLGLFAVGMCRRGERSGDGAERRRRRDRHAGSHRPAERLVQRSRAAGGARRRFVPTRAASTCCSPPNCRRIRSRPGPATCWCRSAIRISSPTSSPPSRPLAIATSSS